MSTRTSIRIGTLVDDCMKQKLPGYKRILEEYTNQYLLFGYRKPVMDHYYASVLFQASKSFGGISCEVGISRTEEIPYYRLYDRPHLGVNGFRVRTKHLLKGLEVATTKIFTGPDSLLGAVQELSAEASSAIQTLLEVALPRVAQEYAIWQPFYAQWQEAEKSPTENPDRRYRHLVGEAVARKILHNTLQSGRFDSFLGPMKFRYREADFLNCHVFLLAKALAFVEPPEPEDVKTLTIDPSADPDKILFDPISALNGRTEQDESVELSASILKRVPEWAFLRSFAALEAFFENPVVDLGDVKTSVREPVAAEPTAETTPPVVGLSMDELYGGVSLIEEGLPEADLPPLEPLAPLEASSPLPARPDPFERIGSYLSEPPAPTTKVADPFELLGAQFGLG